MIVTADDEINRFKHIDCYDCADSKQFGDIFCKNVQTSDLNIFFLNIRSYNKNIDEFLVYWQGIDVEFDMIVLGEAWLKTGVNLVPVNGYDVIATSKWSNQNDGVVVYINKKMTYSFKEVELGGVCGLNFLVNHFKKQYNIVTLYRTHDNNMELFLDSLEMFCQNTYGDKNCILLGDINCNIKHDTTDIYADRYLDILANAGLINGINKPTRVTETSSTIIDHIFVKYSDYGQVRTGVIHSSITDHYGIFVRISVDNSINAMKSIPDIEQSYITDYVRLAELVRQQSWNDVLETEDVNTGAQAFMNILQVLLEQAKLHKKAQIKKYKNVKPWITPGIVRSIRFRDKLSRAIKKQPFNLELRNYFRLYRNNLSNLITKTKQTYYRNKLKDSKNNPKLFWETMNELSGRLRNKENLPVHLFIDKDQDITYEVMKQVGDRFNNYFSNVGENLAKAITPINEPIVDDEVFSTDHIFNLTTVCEADIIKCVSELRGGSAPGIDGIPGKFIKDNIDVLMPPLLHIINLSLQTGIFPAVFKIAKIIPIYKSKNKSDISNYRPISLLCVLSKLLEKIVKKQLVAYLESNNLISTRQYGFRTEKNISDALFDITKTINDQINENSRSLMCFLDMAKAFDSIDRLKLINKLRCMGVTGISLNWFKSYLDDRSQVVSINGGISDRNAVNYGVIQGSTLGPLLFLVYINNFDKLNIDSKLFLFADDAAILCKGNNWNNVFASASADLKIIKKWCDQNYLTLNISKTKYMPIYLRTNTAPREHELFIHSCNEQIVPCNCEKLEKVESYKYLGIFFDSRLRWDMHIDYIKQKLRKLSYMFRQISLILKLDEIKHAYYAFVQSILLYGIIAWGGAHKTVLKPVINGQKYILKSMLRKPRRYPTQELFNETKVLDVRQLYVKTILIYSYKRKNQIFQETQSAYITRYSELQIRTPRLTRSINLTCSYFVAQTLKRNAPPYITNAETGHI